MKITGKIIFRGGKPDSLPDGSILNVKFQDTSRMDAAAVTLGTVNIVIDGHKKENELTYEINADRPSFVPPYGLTVSNIGKWL